MEKLTIAISPIPMSAPIYVAFDKGYFKHEGLDVTLVTFTSGKECLEAVLAAKADVAPAAETPIMEAVMRGAKVRVLATVADSEKISAVITRKDRGISRPEDLKGRKIGVTPGTSGQYLLSTLLLFHGVAEERTTMVPLKPEEMQDALLSGRVDAVATWEPYLSAITSALGPKGMTYYGTGFFRSTWNLVTRVDVVQQQPESIRKLLRALMSSERFIIEKQDEAIALVSQRTGVRAQELTPVWKDYYFRIALDQSLLINFENQAHWAIAHKVVPESKVPNFLDNIYTRGLASVRPERVNIGG
ncbi:MAG TPA: NrtA/SsuA/CpmA family ABC transporter substrate-binding protein [Syntrophorhabdaceae bacterium]|nr:NrtA/SsuA/CpmA family ABC transporter substrate-binding protein [Syntrophorhabdaceae bacterium]